MVNGLATTTGGITVKDGAFLKGSGVIAGGDIIIDSGGVLSPGNSVEQLAGASAIWKSGAFYDWEIQDAGAGMGLGWDHLTLSGSLDIQATSSDPFTVNLITLNNLGNPGPLLDWNPQPNDVLTWTILSAAGGITGFDPDALAVTLNLDQFASSIQGVFSLGLGDEGKSLVISYTPDIAAIPEPGSTVALALLLTTTAGLHRRRR